MLKRLKPTMLFSVNGLLQCNVLKASVSQSFVLERKICVLDMK